MRPAFFSFSRSIFKEHQLRRHIPGKGVHFCFIGKDTIRNTQRPYVLYFSSFLRPLGLVSGKKRDGLERAFERRLVFFLVVSDDRICI